MCVCEQSNIGLRLMLHSSSVTAKLVVCVCVCEQSNIGLILHAVGEFEVSLRFLQKAVELSARSVWNFILFCVFIHL